MVINPNTRYTIPVTLVNNNDDEKVLETLLTVPPFWNIFHDIPKKVTLDKKGRKLFFIIIKTDSKIKPGLYPLKLTLKNENKTITKSLTISLVKEEKFEASIISFPQEMQSDEETYIKYLLKNTGNVPDTLYISNTNANVQEALTRKWPLTPGEQLTIDLPFLVPEKGIGKENFMAETVFKSTFTNKIVKVKKNIPVYHSSLNLKTSELYFPITAGIQFFSTETPVSYEKNRFQFELSGKGNINKEKNTLLHFTLRGPNTIKQPRFGNYDQYSIAYKTQNMEAWLGDYSLQLNLLSLQSRWVRGAFIKAGIHKNSSLALFYGKPRFFELTKDIYGATYTHKPNRKLSYFLEWLHKEESLVQNFKKGWLATSGMTYKDPHFSLKTAASYSNTEGIEGLGFQLRPQYSNKGIHLSTDYLYASKDFFGFYTNSKIMNTQIHYSLNKNWRIGFGYNYSNFNRQSEDFEFGTQPRSEQTFANFSWKSITGKSFQLKLYQRMNIDNSSFPSFDYNETGLQNNFNLKLKNWQVSLQNTISKTTNNLLLDGQNTRTTFDTNLNLLFPFKTFSWQVFTQQLTTNRFNNFDSTNETYWFYGTTLNLKGEKLNGSFFWRNSYAKDELYKNRNFFNANITYNLTHKDMIGFNGGYNVFPSPMSQEELFFSVSYKHTFSILMDNPKQKFHVTGQIINLGSKEIKKQGIRFFINDKIVSTDTSGLFVLKNLRTEKITVDIDKNTIPKGFLTTTPLPNVFILTANKTTYLDIKLIEESSLTGNLLIDKEKHSALKKDNIKLYLKLYNKEQTYFAEVDKNSTFIFNHIIPGNYQLEILNDLAKDKLKLVFMSSDVLLLPGKITSSDIHLKEIERNIRFVNIKK